MKSYLVAGLLGLLGAWIVGSFMDGMFRAHENRQTARQIEREFGVNGMTGEQVEEMRKEARETFKQALVSGAISMGAGAAQCVGAGLGAAGAASDCERQAAKYAADAKALDACASVVNASAKGADGLYGAEIKSIQADAKELEHEASRAGRDKQREGDLERELSEMQNKSLERLETLLQGEHQTRLALIQARA